MKGFTAIFALSVMIGLVLCGCDGGCNCSNRAAGGEGQGAAGTGRTFTVGFDASFPPYGFLGDDGNYVGFDLSLAAEVASRRGWKLVLKPIDWAAKDTELNAGTIDCIWNGFTITDERKEQYTWSEPYVNNEQVVLVKTGSGIAKLADLNGKIVVVQDGSSGAEAIEDYAKEQQKTNPSFAFKDLRKVPEYATAYSMLESGAVDAIGLDSAVARRFLEKAAGKMAILDEIVLKEEFGIGFKKGNTELRDQVQETLKEMVRDGKCAEILEYWRQHGGEGIDFVLQP